MSGAQSRLAGPADRPEGAPYPAPPPGRAARLADSARRIAPLAWPVFIGQLSVLAFSTVDTVLVARHSASDLAALAVGSAAYITTFVGFMGVVMALAPIVGQLFGAGRHADAGRQLHQAVWIALFFAAIGCTLLVFPTPFLALANATPEQADKVRGYLLALAVALPASLLFTAYRAFNVAVSRPKAVMALQIGALALKIPLSTALVFGVPALGVPELGVLGCGIATAVAMWAQTVAGYALLRRDPFYGAFHLGGRVLDAPDRPAIWAQLRLGLPSGAAVLVEVSGFTFMAIFIARLGETPVAGHQIAANLVSLLFMLPLAIANGASTLVAQRIGALDASAARRLGWHGVVIGAGLAAFNGGLLFLLREPVVGLYTGDAAVVAAALPLLAFVAVFHIADAMQTVAAFVLRAWRIATVPLVINATALWGVGLGGGYLLAFDPAGVLPAALHGARGFWVASTVGLILTAAALTAFLAWTMRRQRLVSPGGSRRPDSQAGG
ncbi:MATE family efflux transporter [Rubrivivax gelatinosus]|uniref:MATE family efflux transporter n=1 Tax=Rubrivivax gelatinosus TaxID=28068 RepID=UPI001F5B4803|nr:MATE family efflux transporter [Rubrivivax gelatinosus]